MKSLFESFRPSIWPSYFLGGLIIVSVASLLVVRDVEWRTEGRAAQHRAHVAALDRIVLELTNAETAQRGFLLTGQTQYLERFSGSTAYLEAGLRQLFRSAPAHRAAIDRLHRLADDKLAELDGTIVLAKAGDASAAKRVVATGRGKLLMDQARDVADGVAALEASAARTQEHLARRFQVMFLGVAVLVLASSFFGVLLLARTAMERQRYAIKLLKAVLDASSDPISLRDRDGAYVHANVAAQALLGDQPAAGRTVGDFLPPSEATLIVGADRAVLERQEPLELDLDITTDSGEVRRFAVRKGALRNLAGDAVGVLSIGRDITELHQHQALQRVMVDELNHRVKNTLATIQSIARQTFRGAERSRYDQFEARLLALSSTHDLLTKTSWKSADLIGLVDRTLRPIGEGRLQVEGPEAALSPKVALALSLALHELGVNALKHGAWSVPRGRVKLVWSVDKTTPTPQLAMIWTETGGPPAAAPASRGFGSRLIERGLTAELGGSATMMFLPSGLECEITLPIAPNAPALVLAEPKAGIVRTVSAPQ